MHKLFRVLSTKDAAVLLRTYKTYIKPILEYGPSLFNPQKSKLVALLEKVQNSFARKLMVRRLGFIYDGIPSGSKRNANFKLHSLSHRRRKFDLISFHKILQGVTGLQLDQFCTHRTSYTRSGASSLVLPRARCNARRLFTIRAGSDYIRINKKRILPSGNMSCKSTIAKWLDPLCLLFLSCYSCVVIIREW